MTSHQDVIVVDGLPETIAVLRAVYEPLGRQVHRYRGADESIPVLSGVLITRETNAAAADRQVIVGRFESHREKLADGISVEEPFHYADLIDAINTVSSRSAA